MHFFASINLQLIMNMTPPIIPALVDPLASSHSCFDPADEEDDPGAVDADHPFESFPSVDMFNVHSAVVYEARRDKRKSKSRLSSKQNPEPSSLHYPFEEPDDVPQPSRIKRDRKTVSVAQPTGAEGSKVLPSRNPRPDQEM